MKRIFSGNNAIGDKRLIVRNIEGTHSKALFTQLQWFVVRVTHHGINMTSYQCRHLRKTNGFNMHIILRQMGMIQQSQ